MENNIIYAILIDHEPICISKIDCIENDAGNVLNNEELLIELLECLKEESEYWNKVEFGLREAVLFDRAMTRFVRINMSMHINSW